jgi:hypothetical protein
MKVKTNELSGAALDWAVAVALGHKDIITDFGVYIRIRTQPAGALTFSPTVDWSQGGPIIEREQIAIYLSDHKEWTGVDGGNSGTGPTPLIAAMRCYVASKLGDEVEVSDELLERESK